MSEIKRYSLFRMKMCERPDGPWIHFFDLDAYRKFIAEEQDGTIAGLRGICQQQGDRIQEMNGILEAKDRQIATLQAVQYGTDATRSVG